MTDTNVLYKGRIYLSGTFVIEGVQNHYPPRFQSAIVKIRIISDKFTSDIASDRAISNAQIVFTNMVLQKFDNQDHFSEVVSAPTVNPGENPLVLVIPQPMASLSVWLHLLINVPRGLYHIDYGIIQIPGAREMKSWAFVTPVGKTHHHSIGTWPGYVRSADA